MIVNSFCSLDSLADTPLLTQYQKNNVSFQQCISSEYAAHQFASVFVPFPNEYMLQSGAVTHTENKQEEHHFAQFIGTDQDPLSVFSPNKFMPHYDNVNPPSSESDSVSESNDTHVSCGFTDNECDKLEADLKQKYKTSDYPCITVNVANQFCELLLVNLDSMLPISIYDIAERLSSSQIVYLRGENGSGKRMFLHHLAKEWAENRMLQDFKLVFLISNDELPADFEEISKSIGDSLMLLLVYCWGNQNKKRFGCLQSKLSRTVQCLSNVRILFAYEACPFNSSQSIDHQIQMIGFTQSGLESFIDSCFSDSPNGLEHWNTWISGHAFSSALISRPLYCAMLVHLLKKEMLSTNTAIVNFTSLYLEFIVSFVKQHTSSPIQYLSDLKGDDLKMFEHFFRFCYAYVHSPKSAELSSNYYGLVKEFHPIRFLHHSIPFLLAAMCSMRTYMHDPYNMSNEFDLNVSYNIFLFGMKTAQKDVYNHHVVRINEMFEIQAQHHQCDCSTPEYRIFDPLYWYIYGWCLNNNPEQKFHIPPDIPAEHRQLAIQMIHQSSRHPKLCDQNMTISIQGSREMRDYIETMVKTKQCGYVTDIHICISNITDSCYNDHRFNDLFPYLQTLRIECSNWSSFFDSLSELQFLENLTTVNPLVPSNISSDIQKLSTVVLEEDTSADFLEAMLATVSSREGIVLKTLTICNWDIKEVCFEYLKMLSQSQLLMEIVFNGQCSFDSTNFASFIEQFLQSKLKAVSLPGVIQDSLALKLSTVIKNNLPAVRSDKILTISDSSLSGSTLAPLVSAIANQDTPNYRSPKVSLRVPIEYKYDFHGSRNVLFYGNALLVDNPFIKFSSKK